MRLIREEKTFIREAVLLMLPMILQNFVTFSMSMADTFMVGVLGETALAAVTMANSPFYVMQLMIFGVQSGMSVLVAQYHGRGDQEAINRVMGIALFVSTTITGLLAVTAFCIPEQIMRVLTNNADLVAPGAAYTRYVGFSYFFSAISGVYIAAQRSTENPRLGAVLLTVSGALNIFLNWVLIYGKLGAPMLGCAGAAVATLISRAFEVAVLCVYAAVSRRLPLMPRALLHPGRVIAKDFAKYALPVVCNECLWSLAFSLYTVIMGHMDNNTPILSAYTIAGNLQRMMTPASFAAGGAAAVLIGREIGRGNRGSVQRKAWVLDALALVVGFVCMGIIALVRNVLLRPYILPLMHMEGEACDIAMYMMGILMLVQPVSSVSLTNIVGVLRGGGDVRYAMLCDVGPLYAVCLPLAALTALVWKLDIRYVYPFKGELELDNQQIVLDEMGKDFKQKFVAFAYESICRNIFAELCRKGQIDFAPSRIGSYWRNDNEGDTEIDVAAVDNQHKRLFLGECKYHAKPVDVAVYSALQEKGQSKELAAAFKGYEVVYGLFSKSGFTDRLVEMAAENPNLILIQEDTVYDNNII